MLEILSTLFDGFMQDFPQSGCWLLWNALITQSSVKHSLSPHNTKKMQV